VMGVGGTRADLGVCFSLRKELRFPSEARIRAAIGAGAERSAAFFEWQA